MITPKAEKIYNIDFKRFFCEGDYEHARDLLNENPDVQECLTKEESITMYRYCNIIIDDLLKDFLKEFVVQVNQTVSKEENKSIEKKLSRTQDMIQ